MTPQPRPAGRLVYIMGPSGAGKDTLITHARARVDPAAIVSAHRYITRPAEAGAENHIVLSEAEFIARRDAGLLALSWNSHGFWYGIGTEIESWLARGLVVVVSGSRAAWSSAKTRYPGLLGIVIDAPIGMRAARLAARRREDEAVIRNRLARDIVLPPDRDLHWLDNGGSVTTAGETLVALLNGALEAR